MVQIHINDLIGNFGRYHFWLCALIFFGKFGTGLHQMAIIILAPPAVYTCPNSNSTCCENPVYDTTTFSRTIVTEWNLICDKSWLKDFTQTVFQFGVLIGSLIFGIASDRCFQIWKKKGIASISGITNVYWSSCSFYARFLEFYHHSIHFGTCCWRNYLPKNEVRQQVETYQLQSIRMRQKKGNALDLFRTPNLRSNILVMSFIWFVSSYCYYGVSHYISHLTGDIFVNVVASSGVCLFGCFLAIPLVKFIGRRILVIIFNISSSICLVVIAFIPEGIGSVIMGCVGVLFSFMSFIVVYLYCTEMFPTVVRNSAIGISSMMARFGSMVAPFVAGLRPHGKWCAPITFGVFPIIAAILCILLPETKDIELPMTIEEGEAMGRNSIQQRHASAMIDDNGEQLASIRETEK
nr:solute carrier family 22 member 7-like isoform X2 [Maniola hyperantus]